MDTIVLLQEIFKVCIVPLLGVLTTFIVNYIRKKSAEITANTKSNILIKYIDLLTQTVVTCVTATNQTYVDALKEQDAFDIEAQKIALEKTTRAIMTLLTEDAKAALEEAYGDLGTLINEMIEATVHDEKTV